MLENQFITPEEMSCLHLQSLAANHAGKQPQAKHASKTVVDRVLAQLQEGLALIAGESKDAEELMDALIITESEKHIQDCRKKNQERELLNQLLYGHNKNKQSPLLGNSSQKCLSRTEHQIFVKNLQKEKKKREKLRAERERSHMERSIAKVQEEKKSMEERRVSEIQKKKESIKQNLRKMRENHEKMLITEKQSKAFFNKMRRKKRLYQEMKQSQDQKSLEAARQAQKRLLEHRHNSKLDLQSLFNHDKQYSEWKKQKSLQKSKAKEQNRAVYRPPPRPPKLNQLLEEQLKVRNQAEENKKKIVEKKSRIAEYSSLLKDRMKNISPKRSKTIATDRQNQSTSEHRTLREQIDRTQLGNQYLKQVRLKTKKRSKTQQRYYNPEETSAIRVSSPVRQKVKVSTLGYIPEEKRAQHIQKKKRDEIQKLLTMDKSMSEAEKIDRIKMADQRISRELRRNDGDSRYSTEARSDTLSLLLGTIRAKINMMQ